MAEPFGDYLDRMIYTLYGATQRGIGYVQKHPSHWDVVDYIEDDKTGRPVPIEDSSDHFLLRSFDRAHEYLQHIAIPKGTGVFGFVLRSDGGVTECNECHGEIPWRTFHKESK